MQRKQKTASNNSVDKTQLFKQILQHNYTNKCIHDYNSWKYISDGD